MTRTVAILSVTTLVAALIVGAFATSTLLGTSASITPALGTTSTSSTKTSTVLGSITSTTTMGSGTTITTTFSGCVAPRPINESEVLDTVLNSSVVTGYTKTSFSYNWWYEPRESCTSDLPPIVEVNVTGSQSASGNWTSQYLVTYSNNTLITVEVTFSYQIASLNVTKLPDLTQGINYTAQQKQVIHGAVANSTVQQSTKGTTYYVSYFAHFGPAGNQTYANDYYVVLDQVNGPLSWGIYLNSDASQVIGVYQYHDCRYNNWNGTSCTP